jgi:hypothetical protein
VGLHVRGIVFRTVDVDGGVGDIDQTSGVTGPDPEPAAQPRRSRIPTRALPELAGISLVHQPEQHVVQFRPDPLTRLDTVLKVGIGQPGDRHPTATGMGHRTLRRGECGGQRMHRRGLFGSGGHKNKDSDRHRQ